MLLLLQRRFLSRFAELLRTEIAQTYFQMTAKKLEAVRRSENLSRIYDSSKHLEKMTDLANIYYDKLEMLKQLNTIAKDGADSEIEAIAKEDIRSLTVEIDNIAKELTDALLPVTEYDSLNNCQLEITPGVGGIEASLFAFELTQMYQNYAQYRNWSWKPYQIDVAPSGGLRSAVIFVRGNRVYGTLRYEAGVHRVQRVPVTDKTRIHTSTSVVAVLPEPEKIESCLTLHDVKVETMRASGPGGQNVNQRSTAVRLTHRETGIAVHCMDERTQYANMEIALKRLAGILLQRKLDASQKEYSSSRKLQVGTKARAEKVRTYNFKDDQVVDHRLGKAWQGIANVMRGSSLLHEIIESLNEISKVQHLEEVLSAAHSDPKSALCNG